MAAPVTNVTQTNILGQQGKLSFPARCAQLPSFPNGLTQVDFSGGEGTNSKFLEALLSMYVNNGGNASAVAFTFGSGQVVEFPANSQGYVPILQPNPQRFTVNNPGAQVCDVVMCNFDVPGMIWAATSH